MDNDVEMLALVMVLVLIVASVIAWCVLIARVSNRAVLSYSPRRRVPWGLIDLALILIMIAVTGVVTAELLIVFDVTRPGQEFETLAPQMQLIAILASSISMFAGLVLSLGLIWLKNRPTLQDFGLSARDVLLQVWIGVAAFLLVAAPVYAMQYLLVEVFELRYEHPLIELVKSHPSFSTIAVSFIIAVVIAPLTEEFIIRVVLQGWLERIPGHRAETSTLLLGGVDPSPADHPSIWPVIVSSALFALLHISHGVGVIPLFVLAFGLGYVYRQTHRVLPCIVIHMLFNAFSLFLLLAEVYGANEITQSG